VLGYNAFTDFFPQYPILPNKTCKDPNCIKLQDNYEKNSHLRRLKEKKVIIKEKKSKENEWNIEIIDESEESKPDVK
jgi:hypothetical protein